MPGWRILGATSSAPSGRRATIKLLTFWVFSVIPPRAAPTATRTEDSALGGWAAASSATSAAGRSYHPAMLGLLNNQVATHVSLRTGRRLQNTIHFIQLRRCIEI